MTNDEVRREIVKRKAELKTLLENVAALEQTIFDLKAWLR